MKTFIFSLITIFISVTTFSAVTPTYDDISIPMTDGQVLSADVFIPSGVDSAEVILIQTPYNKNSFEVSLPFRIWSNALLNAQPFIFVTVDWRGFYGSAAAADANADRGQDAYDVCEWIVSQSWHKDRIGTWGPSALGVIQYKLIEKNHPNHTCAVPQVATGGQGYEEYFYGGVLEEARLEQLDALGYGVSATVLANPYDSYLWDYAENLNWFADDIKIPTLQQGGWYDHNIDKMMTFYKDSRTYADASVQNEQWLLVGPWVHGGSGAAYMGSSVQGELSYPTAEFKTDSMALQFFEYYLLDSANGWDATPKITYFDMGGTNSWLSSNSDDIASTTNNVLYLDQNQGLISGLGVSSSSFVSDPSDPSPTIGGATLNTNLDQGPYDQSTLDSRSDVIYFESDVLAESVTVTGRIQLDLWISADQADCDIAVRLVDHYPTGESMLITDGIKRMRFRNNDYTQAGEEFMSPGEVYQVQVDLPFLRYTWQAGHQIKIYISGNHSTRFNVNLQDGGTMYQNGTGNTANISVHHNSTYPSKIILPGSNPTLAIESHQAKSFNIYPNPVKNQIYLDCPFVWENVVIYNLQGQAQVLTSLNQNQIQLNHLSPGLYVIQLTDENGQTYHQKFVKE